MSEKAKSVSYRFTVFACYLSNFTQAAVVNLTPILFIPLRKLYGLSLSALGILTLVNFLAQVLADVAFSRVVDRFGYRPFMILACALTLGGFALFLLTPALFPTAILAGLVLGTVLFSISGGLMEVLLNPIVAAAPGEVKSKAMSVLHSFYSWGQLVVVLVTSLLVFTLDASRWQFIVAGWMLVPLAALVLFCFVPMPDTVAAEERQQMKHVGKKSVLVLFLALMIAAGAAEQIVTQWSSTYLEAGLGLPKLLGDAVGVCSFALMMGLGRLFFGKLGHKVDLARVMLWGAVLAAVCYLVLALSPVPALSVVFCGLSGLGVALLWPGTVCLATERYPKAGTWIFALLACGGDIGAAVGPLITGVVSDGVAGLTGAAALAAKLGITAEQLGLRLGLLCCTVFPLLCVALVAALRGRKRPER